MKFQSRLTRSETVILETKDSDPSEDCSSKTISGFPFEKFQSLDDLQLFILKALQNGRRRSCYICEDNERNLITVAELFFD